MPTAQLNGSAIVDWPSFHAECKAAFGFPDFYGANMDAWIDCLSYLRDEDGMSRFRLQPDDVLEIDVLQSDLLQKQAPEVLAELQACIDLINERYADYGEQPALKLILR